MRLTFFAQQFDVCPLNPLFGLIFKAMLGKAERKSFPCGSLPFGFFCIRAQGVRFFAQAIDISAKKCYDKLVNAVFKFIQDG